jgi:hypothetical protein
LPRWTPFIGSRGGGSNLGTAVGGRRIWRQSELHRAACQTEEDDDLSDLIRNGIRANLVGWTDSLGHVAGLRQLGFS